MACKGLKKDGSACGMRPPNGQEFCLNHGGTKPAPAAKVEKVKPDPAEKIERKGSAASPAARSGDGWGIAAGVVVGLACAGALVYAAHRYLKANPAGAPRLRAVV